VASSKPNNSSIEVWVVPTDEGRVAAQDALVFLKKIQPVPPKRSAHMLWTALIARIYEVLPLLCPVCAGQRARGFCCPADVAMPSFV
jgi:hypothetical protein